MKKTITTAVLAITVANIFAAQLKAGEMETLRGAMELSAIRMERIEGIPCPSGYAIVKDSPIQYAVLAGETARRVKDLALRLQELETANHPDRAPYTYTHKTGVHADDLVYGADVVRFGMEKGRYKEVFLNLARIKKAAASIKKLSVTAAGHANYAFWYGPEMGTAAGKLAELAGNIKTASPDLYSFVTPELRNPKLRKERETFTAKRIAALEDWEGQYLRDELSFNGFRDLVNDAVDLKIMWEIYQYSTMK